MMTSIVQDVDSVRAARDAISTFRTVFPDLAWHAPATDPIPELRTGKGPARLIAVLGASVLAAVVLALYTGVV